MRKEGVCFLILQIQEYNTPLHSFNSNLPEQAKKKNTNSFPLPDASRSNGFLLISVVKCLTLASNGTRSEKTRSLPSEAEPTNKRLTLATDCFL